MLRRRIGRATGSKVFCIGRNKTGTTSLQRALQDLGFKVGDQAAAELLLHHYARRDFGPIVRYCRTAQAFQDIPFSLPYTYQILDYVFPESRFILSIRDNEDVWYESLIRFHQRRLGLSGKPSKEDLMNDPYRYRGFTWEANRIIYDTPEDDPYNERLLKEHYLRHNEDVARYFTSRNDLLVVNLKERGSYQTFCDFLEVDPAYEDFPWLNRSSDAC